MKKVEHFSWTPEVEEALDNLKKTLTSAPVLVLPEPAEHLLLYVASTTQVVSEVLSETKACYPQIQKLIYDIILA